MATTPQAAFPKAVRGFVSYGEFVMTPLAL